MTLTPGQDLVGALSLRPHPEGGWFRETWRSEQSFAPEGYDGSRPVATAIYYLLNPGEESRWHLVRSAELWLWHGGGPLHLRLGGNADAPDEIGAVRLTLGGDVVAGEQPQLVVPPGVWQCAAPAADQAVLVSCVVAPGFDYADFRLHPTGA